MPKLIFEFIDGAAGDGSGELRNRQAIESIYLRSRVLRNVGERSVSKGVFDTHAQLPFGISPMGMCNLAWPTADQILARLAAKWQIPLGVSTMASTRLEALAEQSSGMAWFQLYHSGSSEIDTRLIERASAAGYKHLVFTVDVPEVARRPRELRQGFTAPFRIGPKQFVDFACHPRWSLATLKHGQPVMANFSADDVSIDRSASRATDWSYLQKIRDQWQGYLVVKGILDVEDAAKVQQTGADAIQVSSHGGRQLNAVAPAIYSLAAIRDVVGDAFPLFYDSGVRSGEDILKAYALGADYVFIGRPWMFAVAAGAEQGADQLLAALKAECSIALAQTGLTNFEGVDSSILDLSDCKGLSS